jgi:hypothetical protein
MAVLANFSSFASRKCAVLFGSMLAAYRCSLAAARIASRLNVQLVLSRISKVMVVTVTRTEIAAIGTRKAVRVGEQAHADAPVHNRSRLQFVATTNWGVPHTFSQLVAPMMRHTSTARNVPTNDQADALV